MVGTDRPAARAADLLVRSDVLAGLFMDDVTPEEAGAGAVSGERIKKRDSKAM